MKRSVKTSISHIWGKGFPILFGIIVVGCGVIGATILIQSNL